MKHLHWGLLLIVCVYVCGFFDVCACVRACFRGSCERFVADLQMFIMCVCVCACVCVCGGGNCERFIADLQVFITNC